MPLVENDEFDPELRKAAVIDAYRIEYLAAREEGLPVMSPDPEDDPLWAEAVRLGKQEMDGPGYVNVTARVTLSDGWWAIEVPELPVYTQTRQLAEVEQMAADAVRTMLEDPDIEVRVTITTVKM